MQEMWSLCDRRCNAKQCTVLWMGRQVLYEWRRSCDRSTSRSRYFSLTVNKRTQGISPLKQYQNANKNGRDVYQNTSCAFYNRSPYVVWIWLWMWRLFNAFLWMEIVICKWVWLRKKKWHLQPFNVDIAAIDSKGFHYKKKRLNGNTKHELHDAYRCLYSKNHGGQQKHTHLGCEFNAF